jgi:hypothetical protein
VSAEQYLTAEDIQVIILENANRVSKTRIETLTDRQTRLISEALRINSEIDATIAVIEESEKLIKYLKSRYHVSVRV